MPTNEHTFPPQMAQGAANPNSMQRQEIPMGGYKINLSTLTLILHMIK